MSVDWEEGFKNIQYLSTKTGKDSLYGSLYVRTEDIYQLFKARLIEELLVNLEDQSVRFNNKGDRSALTATLIDMSAE